jgi:voltage-gated potassium channel
MSWEVFILVLSALAIINLFLLILLPNGDVAQVVLITETWLTAFFVIDVARRLHVARDRRAYLRGGHGWLDIASAFPLLRILRLLRIVLTLRLFRRLGGPDESIRAYFADRAAGGLLLVVFLAILVLEFGSLAMLGVERGAPGANITTAADAVWYTIVTISTVGYGDQYPVTDLGRIFGSIIIIIGVAVFGTLTGYLAHSFIRPAPQSAAGPREVAQPAPVPPAQGEMRVSPKPTTGQVPATAPRST